MAQRKPSTSSASRKPSASASSKQASGPSKQASGSTSSKQASGAASSKPASGSAPRTPSSSSAGSGGSASRTTAGSGPAKRPPAKRPPTKRPGGKSIVRQKQTPWGLISTVLVLVLAAAGIISYAVIHATSHTSANGGCTAMIGNNTTTYLNELQCAKDIQGVSFYPIADRNHVQGNITYKQSPPVGGNHSQYWADCSGTVYAEPIANENAVHMLEHGAIWITYKQGLAESQVETLTKLVQGQDRMAMSPYPNLKTPISLQAWGYQLFLNSASDPRIQKFITALRYNPKTTPEIGATCSQPTFKESPSTFGHPLWEPAGSDPSAASGATMAPASP